MTPPRPAILVLGGGAVVLEFYLPAFARLGWTDAIVADPSEQALARIRDRFPGTVVWQADFAGALARAKTAGVTAVVVALPNRWHRPATEQALEAGFDVLCEKPLALTAADCDALDALAQRTGRVLAVGMMWRFTPPVEAMRRVLAQGWLGEIESIHVEDGHPFNWTSESGMYFQAETAGVLANFGVHPLDLIEYLCGPCRPVAYQDDWGGGAEANATLRLETASGRPVTLKVSCTHQLRDEFRITGRDADAWYAKSGLDAKVRTHASGLTASVSVDHPYRFGEWPLTLESAFVEELLDFADAIVTRGRPRATAAEAARTARLIDWAYAHHRSSADGDGAVRVEVRDPVHASLGDGRVVVTGGTGFVGGHLVEALARRGHHDVVVPVRSFRSGANVGRFPVQFARVDLLQRADLTPVFAGPRYVFHLAYGRDGGDGARVTIDGTRHVVDAAMEAGVECLVVLSTTAIFGEHGGETPLDEASAPAPPNREYERTKAEAERQTLERAAASDRTRIVVINPACVYGPQGKTFTELPARLLREGGFCWIEDGRGIVNYVYVTNLVEAILRAAVTPDAHAQRFIVSDGWTTWRDYFTRLLGEDASTLPSFTREELAKLARAGTPTLRDLARAVMGNTEVRRILREHRQLGVATSLTSKAAPGLYGRVRRTRAQPAGEAVEVRTQAPPPEYLADLFGPFTTRLSAARAGHVLGWRPAVDLEAGQRRSRAWLHEIGLLAAEAAE